jgi:hexokinase
MGLPKDIEKNFAFDLPEMKKMIRDFQGQMESGLKGEQVPMGMLPSFVSRPRGTEKGDFLALDLGGTNFRVLDVRLSGVREIEVRNSFEVRMPEHLRHGAGRELFSFIAVTLKDFLSKKDIRSLRRLGFVFSFPVQKTAPDSGTLLSWTKDLTASGVVGRDVSELLRRALEENGVENVRVSALVNDTVATFLSAAYRHNDADMGLILGTGTNACYPENTECIGYLENEYRYFPEMIINTEWGGFASLARNDFDRRLDENTSRPGEQTLEKMVSGLYLGGLVKVVLDEFVRKQELFKGGDGDVFLAAEFETEDISRIEADCSEKLSGVDDFLRGKGVLFSTHADREILKKVCALVSKRAARISAAGVGAILSRMDPGLKNRHVVAVDGALYRHHPWFGPRMQDTLRELFPASAGNIDFVQAKDGSGTGGAIAAAISGR